jgi:hypothetical protein
VVAHANGGQHRDQEVAAGDRPSCEEGSPEPAGFGGGQSFPAFYSDSEPDPFCIFVSLLMSLCVCRILPLPILLCLSLRSLSLSLYLSLCLSFRSNLGSR